jgi:hypothetical protein
VEEKLDVQNLDLILQALYILCNISAGNEKHKSAIMEKNIIKKVIHFLVYYPLFRILLKQE